MNDCHLVVFAGIGSIYFHATLSLLGQFIDEAGILWVCCACAGVWMLDQNLPDYFQQNRYGFLSEIDHFFFSQVFNSKRAMQNLDSE